MAASALRQLEADAEDATEVGSPIRLQQMLSLFFPAFCVVGQDRREIMAEAASGVLDLNKAAWSAGKKEGKKKKKAKAAVSAARKKAAAVSGGGLDDTHCRARGQTA